MAYCAICGKNHDSNTSCAAHTEQGHHGSLTKKTSRHNALEFKKTERMADRAMLKIAIVVGVLFLGCVLLFTLRTG